MKSLVLISKNIKNNELLINSFLSNHKIVLENDNISISKIKEDFDPTFTHITLVYHFNNYFEIPFFTNSGFNKYKYVSDDLFDLFKYAKSLTNNLTIDILSCNLNFIEFHNDIKKIEKELDINIRYSTDLTGNINGNWILESHNVDIKNLYFNDNIDNWNYDLILGVTLSELVSDPDGQEYFGYDLTNNHYYLKKNLVLPTTFIQDTSYIIRLQNNEIFDGKNLSIRLPNSTWGVNHGLFSTTDINSKLTPATIKNLTIIFENGVSSGNGGFINGSVQRFVNIENCISDCSTGLFNDYAGGFVGSYFGQYPENIIYDGYTGTIINCVYKGPINNIGGGGIAGSHCATNNGRVLIKKCSTNGIILGENSGGIVGEKAGYNGDLRITKCFSKGDIFGNYSGGITGSYACLCEGIPGQPQSSFVTIEYCYSEGNLNGNYCGGIVGSNSADATSCLGIDNSFARMNLIIWTCFSTGKITGDYCGGIVGPYASLNTKNYSYSNNPNFSDISSLGALIVSRCYSLCNINTIGSGGICAAGLCQALDSSARIEYCYSVGQIRNNCGGIVGSDWGGYINLYECYALNSESSLVFDDSSGGLLASNTSGYSLTINKCYFENYNTNMDFIGNPFNVDFNTITNSKKTIEDLKYSLDNLSTNNWLAGKHYNDVYPKIMNFTIPAKTSNAEGYDYKYLTNLRTPVYYYQDPSIKLNEIVFDLRYPGLRSTILTEDEVIDLRDWMFNYIFSKDLTLNFFIVSKDSMCINLLPEDRKANFIFDEYVIYPPNKSAIEIDPYGSNVYKGIYCPLPNLNDTFKFTFKNDNTNTEHAVSKISSLNFVETKFYYSYNDGIFGNFYNSYSEKEVNKYLLYFGGCCVLQQILPPVKIVDLYSEPTSTEKLVAHITFENQLFQNPNAIGYKIIAYKLINNIWEESWFYYLDFSEIEPQISTFKDEKWSDPNFTYDGGTYGYRVIGIAKADRYNSAEFYEPVIFNYPYLDVTVTQTKEEFKQITLISEDNIKYITGGLIIESSKLQTPKLSKITKGQSGMPMPGDFGDENTLNFTWTMNNSTNFTVKRYYFSNNQYQLDHTYENITGFNFQDNDWDQNEKIILYTVTAIGDTYNLDSDESLKMPYYNTDENITIIGDILCTFFKYPGSIEKLLFKKDNIKLFNYLKQFRGKQLSDIRSKIFYDYFQTSGIEEALISAEKELLNFGSEYKRVAYSIINYHYYKRLYGYLRLADFTFEQDDTGLYVPVTYEDPEILFYTSDDVVTVSSQLNRFSKYEVVSAGTDASVEFSLEDGYLNDGNFLASSDSVTYNLGADFIVNTYEMKASSLVIDSKGPLPCLTENTKILTSKGYQDIKNIKKGDYIITPDYRKVKIQNIHITIVKGNPKNYPYIIEKNSIGQNYPKDKFTISGDHLILYKNKWILPKNIPKIKQDISKKIIKYYHIELENYETDHLIINNGTIVESFGGYKKYHNVYINRIKNLA